MFRSRCQQGLALTVLGLSTLALPVPAQDAERSVSVTVYNQDLGLVRDVRRLAVPEAGGWVSFREVPSGIDATSVHLKATDGRELQVLEQNYAYDLVSPEKILERYLESPVKVVLKDGRLYEGTLLSTREGQLVMGGAGGAVTILAREKVTDIQCPGLPEGLITRPTLSWLLRGAGGDRQLEVSYLTSGMTWHAEYVAVVAEAATTMDLSGWVSLDNRSGASYPEAQLQLVAGEVHRVTPPRAPREMLMRAGTADMEAQKAFEEESFYEYHLYTLQRPTTLHDNETKQLALFDPAACPVKRIYETDPQQDGKTVRVMLESVNSEANGLGMPLPQGKVRVYQRDKRGQLQFVGEDAIDHTPRDEKIRVYTGKAFDLVVERTELDTRQLAPRDRETDVKIEVRNRKEKEAVTVVVQEDFYGVWEIRRASHDYEKKSSTRIEFAVPVAAGAVATVTYTVHYSW
jgi:hypothetical protein